jgi:hypothetical protein
MNFDSYVPANTQSFVDAAITKHLFELASSMNSVVEVGSWEGKTTHALLSVCKGKVYAVDHFNGSNCPTDLTYKLSGKEKFLTCCGWFPNMVLMEMYSNEAAKLFDDESVDMVFIDAGHLYEEVLDDLRSWYPKVSKVICGHDYSYPSVRQALAEFGIRCTEPVGDYWEHIKNANYNNNK